MSFEKIIQKLEKLEEIICKQEPEFYSIQEASVFLKISKSTLYKLTANREIPFYQPNGKLIYFKKSDLFDWLSKNKRRTINEIKYYDI